MPEDEVRPCLHFVGFRGDEYVGAVRVWGKPDFLHRRWDRWAQSEIHPVDTVVFARGDASQEPSEHAFNDSEVM